MKQPRFAEKLSAALRRGKTAPASENSAASAKATPAPRSGASLPARALLAALFACGIFAGYCLCAAFESALMSAALDADLASARAVARRAPSFANAGRAGGIDEFTKENPFGADVRAVTNTEKQAAAKASPETLKSLTLRGTLPGVGAWIDVSGNTRLVLKGQSVEGFTLSDIKYSEALLSDGAGEHSLYLLLSGGGDKAAASGDRSRRRTRRSNAPRRQTERRAPAKQELDFSGLEPASEGQEGAVPRELVDALLMNPYDELAKVRMVPTPDMSGMKLESLASDSVLARVGVAQGDVISAINGVSITNVADASNALNSLMAGSRFDVTVMRGGKPVELRYHGGFTLIEVLVAVVILATVCTAALKLVILSQNTLAEVGERERLLDETREIEIGILTGELDERGTSGDFRWETEDREVEMFGEDFGRLDLEGLNFDGAARSGDVSETIRVRWREITVRDAKDNSLTLYLESEEDEKKDARALRSRGAEEGNADEKED